jgi:hypothetical protein
MVSHRAIVACAVLVAMHEVAMAAEPPSGEPVEPGATASGDERTPDDAPPGTVRDRRKLEIRPGAGEYDNSTLITVERAADLEVHVHTRTGDVRRDGVVATSHSTTVRAKGCKYEGAECYEDIARVYEESRLHWRVVAAPMLLLQTAIVSTGDYSVADIRASVTLEGLHIENRVFFTPTFELPIGIGPPATFLGRHETSTVGLIGNPGVTGYFHAHPLEPWLHLGVGLRLRVPVRDGQFVEPELPEEPVRGRSYAALGASLAAEHLVMSRAGYDVDAWTGGFLPVTAFGRIVGEGSSFYLLADAGFVQLYPIYDRYRHRDHDTSKVRLVFQTAAEGAYRIGDANLGFHIGPRVQFVCFVGGTRLGDLAALHARVPYREAYGQWSAGAFAGIEARGVWTRLGMLLPLNRPLGPPFREDRTFAVNVELGRRF